MCSVDAPAGLCGGADGGGLVVRPSAEELLRPPRRDLPCPEPGCDSRLPQPSALRLHLVKRHGRRFPKELPAAAVFACPETDCADSGAARKSQFGSMKALKQHYLKVHAPRTFTCRECHTAAFASDALMRAHEKHCGVSFLCSCGTRYSNFRALRSHALKHGHTRLLVRPAPSRSDGLRRLAPKLPPDPLDLLASIALAGLPARAARAVTTCDAGTQTAARRTPRGGRSSGTQTRLTSGPGPSTGKASEAPPSGPSERSQPAAALASRTAGSQCVAVAAVSAASQAGPPLVCLLWPAPVDGPGLVSCHTQTERRLRGPGTAPETQETLETLETGESGGQAGRIRVRPLEELLWEPARETEEPQQTQPLPTQAPEHQPSRQEPTTSSRPSERPPAPQLAPQTEPAANRDQSQTNETDMLSAETQTHDSFDGIKHLLRSEEEQLLFPELSELSGTDIQTQTPWLTDDSQTQTPWLTGDSQTQTPWWSDDPARMMTSQTQTAPVTHMETQTCLLCLGPCDCWGD